jgi:hypothetical protein
VSTLQVVDNDLVANRDECLIQAVTAFASSLQEAQSRFPFIRACRSVTGLAGLLAYESEREDIHSAAKQGSEQIDLVGGSVGRLANPCGRRRKGDWRGGRGGGKF